MIDGDVTALKQRIDAMDKNIDQLERRNLELRRKLMEAYEQLRKCGKAKYVSSQECRDKREDKLDQQIGGDHYLRLNIQPIEFIEQNNLPFLEGCVIKRMCRHREKGGTEDLRKAIHEIQMILELRYREDA